MKIMYHVEVLAIAQKVKVSEIVMSLMNSLANINSLSRILISLGGKAFKQKL